MCPPRPPPATETAPLVVHLCGVARLQFGLADGQQTLDRKTAALLALVHLEPGIRRATAACWLWPDSDTAGARANLRVLLFRLTRLAGRPLVAAGDFLRFEPAVEVLDDAAQLHAIAASDGSRQPLPLLLDGIACDDLPELQAWLARARRRVAERIRNALRERALQLEEAGRPDAAAALAEWRIEVDPGDESAYRELMRLQIARGERAAALAAYERCRSWMNRELGVGPSPATRALHAEALSPPRPAVHLPENDRADAGASVVDLCRRLERVMGEGGERFVLERLARAALLRLPAPELAPDAQAYCCGVVARYHFRAGHAADAAAWSDQALAAAREADVSRLVWALGQRINLALEALDLGLACTLLAEAEQLARGEPDKLSRVWHQIGAVLLVAGRLDAAETAMRRSIEMLEAFDGPKDDETIARLPAMRINLAHCLLDQGRDALAESVLDVSLVELDRHPGFRARELRVAALLDLVLIHRQAGRFGQGRATLTLARAGMNAVTMSRYPLFADLYGRLLNGTSAQAALDTLAWINEVDCGDAIRIAMLRDLASACLQDGLRDAATRVLEAESRLHLRSCRALLRAHGRRWLRAFAREAGAAMTASAAASPAALSDGLDVFERLSTVAELREGRDGRHGARVGALAARLAGHIGAPRAILDHIEAAARLHDVGKAALSDAVLRAPHHEPGDDTNVGPSLHELRAQHTTLGATLLAGHASPAARLGELVASQHHERWDGHGYPSGLAGPAIGLAARIVALADAYEREVAQPEGRPAVALAHIEAGSGTAFDPQLVRAFVSMLRAERAAPHRAAGAPDWLRALPTL